MHEKGRGGSCHSCETRATGRLSVQEGHPHLSTRIVAVGVDQHNALPRSQLEASLQNRNRQAWGDEGREHVISPVTWGAMTVSIARVPGQDILQERLYVLLRAASRLEERHPRRGMRHEHAAKTVPAPLAELLNLTGDVGGDVGSRVHLDEG